MSNLNKRLAFWTVISMIVYCGKMQAQSDSGYTWKSPTTSVCIKHIEVVPAQYAVTVVDVKDSILEKTARIKHDEATPNKSRFSLASVNRAKASNLRTSNLTCSTELTIKNEQGVLQNTKTWPVTIREDVAVIDFSGLSKGTYTVSIKTKDGVETFNVRFR